MVVEETVDAAQPLVEIRGLRKWFGVKTVGRHHDDAAVHAVDGVDLKVGAGRALGLVGESGCGKSTLVRLIMRLLEPTDGQILVDGTDITTLKGRELRPFRRRMQMVFQDPYASLNPRMCAWDLVAEPLRVVGEYDQERVGELFDRVGLSRADSRKFAREFSGGQRQRICIARALALRPRVLALDEPVSALDVSVQAHVLNLLKELREDLDLTYIFVSHDLAVVRYVCDEIAVMYLGKIVEMGPTVKVHGHPQHPYTEALLSSVPVKHPAERDHGKRIILSGDAPSAVHLPTGCRFRGRCWKAQPICATEEPELNGANADEGTRVACHFPG